MIRTAFLRLFAPIVLAVSLAAPVKADISHARVFWSQLQSYEKEAMRDYASNNISHDVLQLSDRLFDLSIQARLSGSFESCRRAANVLSQMVAGNYYSAVANRVATDWLTFQGRYVENRKGCIKALDLSERDYQLPWWFGW